jgi:hypothetical protein
MNRTAIAFSLILALLISAVAGTQIVFLAGANPYYFVGEVPPDQETYPPNISVSFPQNNTAYATNRLSLNFSVTPPQSKTAAGTYFYKVTYETDWGKNPIEMFPSNEKKLLSYSLVLSNVPEGKHSILIQAFAGGIYLKENYAYNEFRINSASKISFTIDRTAPTISVLSPENSNYTVSDIPLNFSTSEACSQIAYALDGKENVTITGNSTLSGLLIGPHNMTVFVWDDAGNVGASETALFIVQVPEPILSEPFPTVPVAAVSVAVALAVAGLLVYFKKLKH